MKNFFQHIENLLIRNDYVIVPNLGGFVVQQQSSEIQDNTIIPPLAVIGFNPLLQHSDGLLEMEIARTEQIAYRQAVNIINNNILRIKNLLHYGETVAVGKIGEIIQNKETLIFTPASNFQFLPANFNLQKVDFHLINNKNKYGEKPITLTLYPKTILRYAASIALIFGFLGVQPFLDKKPQQASFVNMLNNVNAAIPETAEFSVINQDITEEKTENIVVEKQETAKNFHLIVGCFQTYSSAENYANLLKNRGLQIDVEIFSSANLQRVSVGSFATFNEAKNALKNLQNSDKVFENLWIMCKKM
jgi:nucleoid DNA-binding protein